MEIWIDAQHLPQERQSVIEAPGENACPSLHRRHDERERAVFVRASEQLMGSVEEPNYREVGAEPIGVEGESGSNSSAFSYSAIAASHLNSNC